MNKSLSVTFKKFLEMARQLFLEIVDLKRTLDRICYSKTLQGKYFNFLGCNYFFFTSVLLLFQSINSSFLKIFSRYIVLGRYLL